VSRATGALQLIEQIADTGSFCSWDSAPLRTGVSEEYRATLARAAHRGDTDESILTGKVTIGGHAAALVVSEFRFLGGSVGRDAADRLVAAVRRATTERLPLIASPASGGTRMQEGTPAFVTMVDITRAVEAHKAAGLPYLVYLRHPSTGGALASWGSLGHLTLAEPGALTGFLGPSVYEALHGTPFPEGVQRAEHLTAIGIADAAIPLPQLRATLHRVLRLLDHPGQPERHDLQGTTTEPGADLLDWAAHLPEDPVPSIALTRHPDRPGVRELLDLTTDDRVLLPGTGAGERATGLIAALTAFRGHACVVIGQDRTLQREHRRLLPADLRVARRAMRLAAQLRLPVVTIVDTPGAELSVEAEEGAIAGEIARCVAALTALTVPSVSVLLGEGCGGGALALLPARRVVTAEHGWLAPLPPEGASTILHGTTAHAADLARSQRVGARSLVEAGIAHAVVFEPVPAHDDPAGFCGRVADAIAHELRRQGAHGSGEGVGDIGQIAVDGGGHAHRRIGQGADLLLGGPGHPHVAGDR
jgi:acetyl-CoA carboxylase carboxyl transferase subunit beta